MKVLVAEDSAVDRHIIANCVKDWGFELTIVDNGSRAWEILHQADAPRLVLLDWMLPGMDGIQLCREVRNFGTSAPYVYVIVVTAKDKKQDLLQAMEAGADDYLVKPFDELELKARLIAGKRLLDLHEELLKAGESLRFAATHDALTGLWHRGEITNFLQREMVRADREKRPLGVILADLDHFKNLNDTFGHLAGDGVLKEVARRLSSSTRVYDSVGRYGGEEFLVVMPGCDLKTSARRAEDLRTLVSAHPIMVGSKEVVVTLSLGVAITAGSADSRFEEVLQRADRALYEAKNKGRNRVETSV